MNFIYISFSDLVQSLRAWRLWTLMGWLEIRQRYSRSTLGPLWLTISMGVMVTTLGIVYGTLFGLDISEYLPVIAIGLVAWGLFSSIVSEGTRSYVSSANFIRNIHTPRLIYILQVVWRNLIIFFHNFVIIALVLLVFGVKSWATLFLFIPGLILLVFNAMWIGAFAGLLSARFRDLPQIIDAFLQVSFYVTPILFTGQMLQGRHEWIVIYNPLAHLINTFRDPLLGVNPSFMNWSVGVCMAIAGWMVTLVFTGRYHKRIPYWL